MQESMAFCCSQFSPLIPERCQLKHLCPDLFNCYLKS